VQRVTASTSGASSRRRREAGRVSGCGEQLCASCASWRPVIRGPVWSCLVLSSLPSFSTSWPPARIEAISRSKSACCLLVDSSRLRLEREADADEGDTGSRQCVGGEMCSGEWGDSVGLESRLHWTVELKPEPEPKRELDRCMEAEGR